MRACTVRHFEVSVSVVDRYGNLKAFMRTQRALEATIAVSQSRATHAAYSGKVQGQVDDLGIGLPLTVGVTVVAAIGVSGGSDDDDNARCALAGKQELQAWYTKGYRCQGKCTLRGNRWRSLLNELNGRDRNEAERTRGAHQTSQSDRVRRSDHPSAERQAGRAAEKEEAMTRDC